MTNSNKPSSKPERGLDANVHRRAVTHQGAHTPAGCSRTRNKTVISKNCLFENKSHLNSRQASQTHMHAHAQAGSESRNHTWCNSASDQQGTAREASTVMTSGCIDVNIKHQKTSIPPINSFWEAKTQNIKWKLVCNINGKYCVTNKIIKKYFLDLEK